MLHISKLYLDQEGIAIIVGGETQAAVYYAVLENPHCAIHVIKRLVNERQEKRLMYTTIATIANKLCNKGILTRQNVHQTKPEYRYTVLVPYDELIETAFSQLFSKLAKEFPQAMLDAAIVFME
jgi:predicted transcriptional regulator